MNTKRAVSVMKKLLGPANFGGFMHAARVSKDKSQVEMADYLGISKSTLCDIEKGRQLVSVELAAKLAKQCGMSEALAVEYAIQDSLKRAGLKLTVKIKASA